MPQEETVVRVKQPWSCIVVGVLLSMISSAAAQTINEQHIFSPDPGSSLPSHFGEAVAIAGNCALVGAPWDSTLGINTGAVYVFDLGTGALINKIQLPDPQIGDRFGMAIDAQGTTAVVGMSLGARVIDVISGEIIHSMTYEEHSLSDEYGSAVCIEGDRVIVGAKFNDLGGNGAGTAYVYDLQSGGLLGRMSAPGGAEGYHMGTSVDAQGGSVILGAPGVTISRFNQGAALLYNLNTTLYQHAYIHPDPGSNDGMGTSAALLEDRVILGSPYRSVPPRNQSGAVQIFDRQSRSLIYELIASDFQSNDRFGYSLSCDGDLLLVGSPGRASGGRSNAGGAYVFNHRTGEELYILEPAAPDRADQFGSLVALHNGRALLSAPYGGDEENGLAYGFLLPLACRADLTGDGVLNFFDISDYLVAYTNGEASADLVHDGQLNAFDVLAFVEVFQDGCP